MNYFHGELQVGIAYLKQNLNSNDRLKDIHTKLSEIRSENLTDSGHMTELKTEVGDCKKIIKFLETEIGCKNVERDNPE
jgi:hypothetical protein